MDSVVARSLVLLLAGSLQACCFRSCHTAGSADAAPAAAAVRAAPLEIVSWGPRRAKAGIPFNARHGGRSVMWFRVNQSLDGRTVLLRFNDTFIETQASGHTVTVVVPEAAYASPGTYALSLNARTADASRSSNEVQFTVE